MGPTLLAFEEVTNVVGVGLGVAGGTDTGMPKFCSTQYEAPDTKVQDDASTGFYSGLGRLQMTIDCTLENSRS
jgi:hypothetical protein